MIGVLYYRGGNARNVLWALQRLQIPARKVERPHDLHHLAGLILPGVGAAPAAMNELARVGTAESPERVDSAVSGDLPGHAALV